MKTLPLLLGITGLASAAAVDDFIAVAREKHGVPGETASRFLVANMPEKDKVSLSAGFLEENLDLAFKARASFPWAAKVPEEIFLNDVLPYAVFDESREAWRPAFYETAREVVKDAQTASEAAQALNREFFKRVKVHYGTGRKSPNQSPKESMELGIASCSGLSILLVDACRAVGIPARAVGTPMWANGRGNHTWVEIWDGGWHFTGADEYDKSGLDHGWFVDDAAKAKADDPEHAIYATSWRHNGLAFPMVWAPSSRDVAAVNVTSGYARKTESAGDAAGMGVRLFESNGGQRMVADVRVVDGAGKTLGEARTKAGTADLNDMPCFKLARGLRGWLRFTAGGVTREMEFGPLAGETVTVNAAWDGMPEVPPAIKALEAWLANPPDHRPQDSPALSNRLTKPEAVRAKRLLAADLASRLEVERKPEMDAKVITFQDKKMRWLENTFGGTPPGGHSLWISMHGGGGAPPEVNDGQWRNQIRLYQPDEGIYIAPRAPTDTWNLWHEAHIDPMFQRLIEDYVVLRGVDPDKVYLMGYSAGGDGVWQLAPRMADCFAAAAMMAGHPNESSVLGLRNLPLAVFVGGGDSAYNRNKVVAEKAAELDRLAESDPGGYIHMSRVYPGLGHWMNLKDAEALPWMEKFTRNPWPQKIVWFQDDVTHDRFYWLKIPDKAAAKAGWKTVAAVAGQTIRIDGDVPPGTSLLLSDELLDLDQAVSVIVNGGQTLTKAIPRTAGVILHSLEARADLPATPTAVFELPRG